MKADIASHICVIAKKHILNLRKENIGAVFLKRGRKYIELDYFDQRNLSRVILGFIENIQDMLTINIMFAKCKDIRGFIANKLLHKTTF